MDEKNKQLLDQILKYAAERKIQIPADIVLKLSTIYAEDLYSELKQGQAPSEMEGKILMGTLRKLVEQIVLEEIPEFGLMNPGLVPAPGRSGLMLMSTGWKPYLMPSAPGGGGGGTGISDAPGDSQSYVRYNRTWIVMPPRSHTAQSFDRIGLRIGWTYWIPTDSNWCGNTCFALTC